MKRREVHKLQGKPAFESLEPRLLLSAEIHGAVWNDLDANGVVDGPDYTEVLSFWATGIPPEPPGEPTPEPTTLALLLAGGLVLFRRRRK